MQLWSPQGTEIGPQNSQGNMRTAHCDADPQLPVHHLQGNLLL